MVPSRTAAMIAVAAGLALPAAAQAKTTTMLMGPPPATQKTLGEETWVNAYFPSTLTINAGDSVKFTPVGFHTVNIPPRNGPGLLPIFTPKGTKVENSADEAGAPFWFNGQDNLGFHPELLASSVGKKLTYTGAKRIQSGLPLASRPKPMTVKFTKAGTYEMLCDLHPGMKAKVKVLKKGAKVPTAAERPANTVSLGVAAKGGLEYLGMVPSTLSVPQL